MAGETMNLIGTYVIPSNTSSYSITNIPQTANDLYIQATFTGDTSQNGDGRIAVYPNGDSGNMYMIYRGSNGGTSVSEYSAAYYIPLPQGSYPSYGPSTHEITIFDYSSSTLTKAINWESSMVGARIRLGVAHYLGTSPITSLGFQIRDYGTVMNAGSSISLYTIKRA
jgi:hypothetical protein